MKRSRLIVLVLAALAVAFALAGCGRGPTPSLSGISPNDGQALVSVACSHCHPIDRVNAARKTRAGWTATIARMRSHGLQVTTQQAQAIVDYLTKRDGGS